MGRRKGKNRGPNKFLNDVETNKNFEEYYASLNFVSDFELFLNSLREPLPTNFRFTGSRSTAFELRDLMINEYFPALFVEIFNLGKTQLSMTNH